MKKIFTRIMLWAVAATALASCANNDINDAINDNNLIEVTLTADKTAVRTELDGVTPLWSVGDKIGVYAQTENQNGELVYQNESFENDNKVEATPFTTFSGKAIPSSTLYVYYPYVAGGINEKGVVKANLPSTQQPTATSFDGKADIMIAKPVTIDENGETLENLQFARLGAIVKIVLKNAPSTLEGKKISSLTMTAGSNLAGKVYLDAINQELGELYDENSQSKSVTANYTTATAFEINDTNATYVIVYPQTLATGSTLSFEATTDGYAITKTATLNKDIVLESGKLTTLNVDISKDTTIEEIEDANWINNAYNLVPSTANLAIGDKVVIVAAGYDKAMGAQNSNNRAAVNVTKGESTVDITAEVEILTVAEGTKEGTFAFQTSSGKYLYAASSSSNHLKEETTLSDNSSFLVTIKDGVATVVAQGANSKNTMRYNPGNTPPIFSCYGSGQADIAIYKLVGEYVVKDPAIKFNEIANVTLEHDATSGSAAVSASNAEGWTITANTEATWVTNLAYANNSITFSISKNESDTERTATVNITAVKDGYNNVTASFTITQKVKPAEGSETTSGWVKVENIADFTEGTYVIVHDVPNKGAYVLPNAQATSAGPTHILLNTKATVSGTTLSNVSDDVKWNLSGTTSAMKIQSAANTANYLYVSGSGNSNLRVGSSGNDKTWTISAYNGGFSIKDNTR